MTEPLFNRIAILGLGLIGSSIALAVRRGGLAETVVGYDKDAQVRAKAEELALADRVRKSAAAAVEGADLIVIAVPVRASADVAREISEHLKPGAVVTDVGSVKSSVICDVLPEIPDGVAFVPGHPIAGTEQSGPEAGFPELFEGRWCILTRCEKSTDRAMEQVTAFWRAMGADIDIMDPEHHDLVLAITSHVPHLIAYNIVGTAADLEKVTESEVVKFSASGFRDFTRIAASDPIMWRDIFLSNKGAVLEMLGRFSEDLAALQRAIRWEDGPALQELFTRTREIRREIIEAGQETAAPDFGRPHGTGDEAG